MDGEKKKRAMLIDVYDDRISIINYSADVSSEWLKCTYTDVCTRSLNGVDFTFVVDDGGLLKEEKFPSFVDMKTWGTPLVGNLIVLSTRVDDDGESLDLSDDEIKHLIDALHEVKVGGKKYHALVTWSAL